MAKGQKTGGRRRGTPNKRTQALRTAVSSDLTPKDFFLSIMRSEEAPMALRFAAAAKVLPYCHSAMSEAPADGAVKVNRILVEYVRANHADN